MVKEAISAAMLAALLNHGGNVAEEVSRRMDTMSFGVVASHYQQSPQFGGSGPTTSGKNVKFGW